MEESWPGFGADARGGDGGSVPDRLHGWRRRQPGVERPCPRIRDPRTRELHRKRAARRLCKQTLYDLCRKVTGIQPPWGSLTGVRPTHLMLEALAEGLTPEEAVLRLERDFDVTPEKAELLARIAGVQREMPAPGDEWMDVYIGIPFCTTRCAYCSFSSGEIGDGRLVAPYLEALEREMRAGAEILRESGRTLRAVYVGGGTPTALPEAEFRRLTERMIACFPGAREYTVEAGRPDTITRDKLRAIREAGVRRISINPQTMNDRTLQLIGRAHTAEQVREAYALAREEGIPHINMDVIAGLPGKGEADFARTMAEAVRLAPESLTVHTLAIKRSSPLGERQTAARQAGEGRGERRPLPSGGHRCGDGAPGPGDRGADGHAALLSLQAEIHGGQPGKHGLCPAGARMRVQRGYHGGNLPYSGPGRGRDLQADLSRGGAYRPGTECEPYRNLHLPDRRNDFPKAGTVPRKGLTLSR